MYKSKEIRWFHEEPKKGILNWFAEKGKAFENTDSRTDFYLPVKNEKGIGIKLREGNIEVKHRISEPKQEKLSQRAEGFFERYLKWSFDSSQEDSLSREIIKQQKYNWVEVKKERMGFKLKEKNGEPEIVDMETYLEYGCQLEYTRISIQRNTWYSFALEWFGEKEIIVLPEFWKEILGNEKLKKENSMGYADFIVYKNVGRNY